MQNKYNIIRILGWSNRAQLCFTIIDTCGKVEQTTGGVSHGSSKFMLCLPTYPIVEASSNSFGFHPQLPLAGLSVPRRAEVVPREQLDWIVETEQWLAMDCHWEEALVVGIGHPKLDLSVLLGTWKDKYLLWADTLIQTKLEQPKKCSRHNISAVESKVKSLQSRFW